MLNLYGEEIIDLKECIKCGQKKPLEYFPTSNSGHADNRRPECKDCIKILEKQRKKFRKMRPPKGYICPICRKNEEQVKGKGGKKCTPWVVDHDHITGEFRGFLCHNCNRGNGFFNDDPKRTRNATLYLKGKFKDYHLKNFLEKPRKTNKKKK